MFEKRHMVALADAMRLVRPFDEARFTPAENALRFDQWERNVTNLAEMLSRSNPKFDFGRFYEACGLEKSKQPTHE